VTDRDKPTKLTDPATRKLKPRAGRRRVIRDLGAESLYLVIQPSGRKSWMMRFRRPNGKVGKLVVGQFDLSGHEKLKDDPEIGQALSLKAARALASKLHRDRKRRDVIADHKADRHRLRVAIEEGAASTFGSLARKFIAEHARPETRHWRESARVLGLNYPKDGGEPTETRGGLAQRWADKDVRAIDGHDVYSVVDESRRTGIPGLAKRTAGTSDPRARSMARTLSKFFAWLVEHRRVAVNPCLGQKVPPPRSRDRALTEAEVKKFWEAAGAERAEFAAPLKLLLLTGQRLSEVTGMMRSELTEDLATWKIPGVRTKNRRAHVVPLAPLAQELIESVAAKGDVFVFTTDGKAPVSLGSKIKNRLDASMNVPPWRVHDLRRTAVTGMAELGIRPDVIELCVNHVSGTRGGIAGVYNKSELLDERRAALERWATHVAGVVSGEAANVVPLKRGAS
jgi:integrase